MSGATRRWPDLMVGTLVVLLLGGFGTLLVRPQPSTPVSPGSPSGETGSVPAIPGAPGTVTTGTPDTQSQEAAPVQTPATDTAATGQTEAGQTGAAPSTETQPTEAPVIEAAPIGAPDPTLNPATSTPTGTTEPAAPTDPATTGAETSAPAARTGGAVPTSEQRTPLRSDYRITLGTFSSVNAAQTAAQGVSALGYTVYPIDLGGPVVAQVGPFADEDSAREALADVQRAYPGAVLYPPRNRSLSSAAQTGQPQAAEPQPAQSQPEQPQTTPATTPATSPAAQAPAAATTSEPTYLQVGAFDRLESAQNLVQQLRDLGYNPTVNAPAGKKVTVLVGPYTGEPLTRTEARLGQNGLQSFRVR